jgi:diketogulonate reductase-like aldo/keto reductase
MLPCPTVLGELCRSVDIYCERTSPAFFAEPLNALTNIGFREPPVPDPDRLFDIVDVLKEVAKDAGSTPAVVALAWLLTRPAVSSVIIAGRTDEHYRENLKAMDLKLSEAQLARLNEASARPLPYPYWHQSFTASDRLSPADLALHAQYLKK